jgi:NAD(P)-dependent dehydrogenase (short-subunit alcohol dehydrogenase family)
MEIRDKIAVITGAASGIGAAVAGELVRRGVKGLVLVDRSEKVHELRASLATPEQADLVVATHAGDVTDESFRRGVFDQAVAEMGVPRICVPAAGVSRDHLSVKIDKQSGAATLFPADDFRFVVEVNLTAPVYWALETVARIAQDRRWRGLGRWTPAEPVEGTVIFIGSVSSQGNKGQIAYAATKAGLVGAAATLGKEAMFFGVRSGVVHPGFTDTPMVRALQADYVRDKVLPQTALGRLIRPAEVADAICFMIANSAISGELWVDAGWTPPV